MTSPVCAEPDTPFAVNGAVAVKDNTPSAKAPSIVMVLPAPEVEIPLIPKIFKIFKEAIAVPLSVTKSIGIFGLLETRLKLFS